MNQLSTLRVYLLFMFLFTLISCSDGLDRQINRDTLELDIEEIKNLNPEMDSLKIDFLEDLLAISQGRDQYLKQIDFSETLQKYVVDESSFEDVSKKLFGFFATNEITYGEVFQELDTLKSINSEFDEIQIPVYRKIDSLCLEKQSSVIDERRKAEEMRTKLNEMVDLQLISLRETTESYRDVIEVKVKMTNLTSQKIEAIGFNLVLTDKLGTDIATLRCKSNDGFMVSDVGRWVYNRYDRGDIYKSLENVKVSHVSTKQEITKINVGGTILSAYPTELQDIYPRL